MYTSDATSAAYLVREMADRRGVVYMRTTRGAYPVLYGPDEAFPIGGAKLVRSSPSDQVTLIGAGVTLHNCLAAADELARDGVTARVLDLYSVKPVDTEALLAAAAATSDRIVVAEDHYPAGGIGEAVLEAFNDAGHPVQIAHLAGGGGYDLLVDEALGVYAEAIERGDSRVRHLFFDASGIPIAGMWEQNAALLTGRMRQIGMDRILFGCDSPIPGNSPREFLERWRKHSAHRSGISKNRIQCRAIFDLRPMMWPQRDL